VKIQVEHFWAVRPRSAVGG